MAIEHVQMASVDRLVRRFNDSPTGMVQVWAHIGQLDEVLKVGQCCFPPATIQVEHIGGAINWSEADMLSADGHVISWVAG